MSLIDISGLTFRYDGSSENIFENVSFRIDTDWKLGFTGRNGRGKTTFLNLLLGKLEYKGKITANVDFEYFPYSVGDSETVTSDILNNMSRGAEKWKLSRELNRLAVSEDVLYRPFSTLSNGEQTKVMIAALFLRENSFLLIDEPTNHLDVEARRLVSEYLNTKKGFILVSHDRAFLDGCIDHILSINKSDIEIQQGNFTSWLYNKRLQDNFETEQNERLKKDIKRLEAAARKAERWADKVEATKIGFDPRKHEKSIGSRSYIGEQSRRMQQRRKNLEHRQNAEIKEKSGLLKNIEESEPIKLITEEFHSKRLAEFRNVTAYYGKKTAFEKLSFVINTGDRIALLGRNGSGKSTVIKLLTGDKILFTGEIFVANGLKISYVPQDTSFLRGTVSDFENKYFLDKTLFRALLRQLDFSRAHFEKDMSEYSAGQKKKVLIAKSLSERANLYIWDEPLNFIDVLSRIQIENLITEYKPTMLFVEHDSVFCENTAIKIIRM